MLFLILLTALFLIVLFLNFSLRSKQNFGLKGENIYSDTPDQSGETLYSTSLPLKGRPDYIIKSGKQFIPVEIKSGKTPHRPHSNHIAQLTAYCLLVEENFGVKPHYGIIKYPEKEFKVEYSDANKEELILNLDLMLKYLNGQASALPQHSPNCKI